MSSILDSFVGNEDISGVVIEKFPDQPPNMVRVVIETNLNSYTKNLTIHVNKDRVYTIYCGYRNGIPFRGGGTKYNQVSFEVDDTRPNVLFSFWKARNFGLLERVTERNYSVDSIKGNTLIVSWPNRNNPRQFALKQNRHTPSQLGLNLSN